MADMNYYTLNNKLIAEFIGYEVREKNDLKGTYTTWYLPLLDEQKMPEHLFFHESWEWLMPVARKIRELYIASDNWYFNKKAGPISSDLISALSDCEQENIYKTVVEFIKWYNENQES